MTYISFSKKIQKAINNKKPIVALESTIISHGMPYPENVDTGIMLEKEVENNGGVPATIAIMNGQIKIGLSTDELEGLGKKGLEVTKVSRRDIPFVINSGGMGATTVASTMIFAAMAQIKFFATGGIGGVHREGENTMDISADLTELSKTKVAVVSAGVKSILDIGRTLEYLETLGVPVIGYGVDEFPAFYTRESGFQVDYKLDKAADIAKALKVKWDLGLDGGAIIANPIPKEFSYEKSEIDKAIDEALSDAKRLGIKGKKVTPFLLAKVKEITKGKSLESNIALAKNNAKLAAQIAVQYHKLILA